MDIFTENESYKHKMAKEVLKGWFYDDGFVGDVGREGATNYEVFLEYPITKSSTYIQWPELWGKSSIPTYNECINLGYYPKRIVDVVYVYKGIPDCFIEICHKNPTSQEKINELEELGVCNLIEIDAEWIMKQTKKPDNLKYKRLI